MIHVYPIAPVPAPRQTRADAFKRGRHVRPEVARYRAFRDEIALFRVQIPDPFHHVLFVVAMPPSWSEAKRLQMYGQPHKQRPDRDNLEKALLDAVYGEDSHVWDGRVTKVWGPRGLIIISGKDMDVTPPIDLARFERYI